MQWPERKERGNERPVMMDFLQALRRAKAGRVIISKGGDGQRYMYEWQSDSLKTEHGGHSPLINDMQNDWVEE